jgi:hypothetical protein
MAAPQDQTVYFSILKCVGINAYAKEKTVNLCMSKAQYDPNNTSTIPYNMMWRYGTQGTKIKS